MTESYLMINPEGRFYQNTEGKYIYSSKILEVGLSQAIQEIEFNDKKFIERKGVY